MHYCDRNCEKNDQIHKKNASYPTECYFFSSKKDFLAENFQLCFLRLYLRVLIKVKVKYHFFIVNIPLKEF